MRALLIVSVSLLLVCPAGGGEVKNVPSEKVLRWASIIAPEAKELIWEYDAGEYEILALNAWTLEEFEFRVAEDGQLLTLEYDNERTGIEEKPDELVLEGNKREIAVSEIPKAMLDTLGKLFPNLKPSKAWYANSLVGPRYVVQVENIALYATVDGRIRCGGAIEEGALNELDPSEIDF